MQLQGLLRLALMVVGGISVVDGKVHTVDLHNADGIYYTHITLGTPPQEFSALVDTASANVWIPGTKCVGTCESHLKYDHDASSTYKANGTEFANPYPEGRLFGIISQDTLRIGSLSILNQDFGEVEELSGQYYENLSYDGVIGLAFRSVSQNLAIPPLYNARDQGSLDEAKFALYLGGNSDSSKNDGELTLGGYDKSKFEGDITWVRVIRSLTWEVEFSGIKLPDGYVDLDQYGAVLSTNTPFIYIPSELARKFNANIGAKQNEEGRYVISCEAREKLPNIDFYFGGKPFTVGPDEYIYMYAPGSCMSAIIPYDIPPPIGPQILLGTSFLRTVYSIYDLDNYAVGLAKAA